MAAFQQSGTATGAAHGARCVCTICECGRHKCPPGHHSQGHYDADTLRSTYGKDFPQHADSRRQPIRHADGSHVKSNDPFDHKTTHSLDFTHHAGARPSSSKRPQAAAADRGIEDRDFKSEGASQYGTKPGNHRRESFAPRGASIVSGLPFDGNSTSKTDFPGWRGIKPPTPYKLSDSVLRPGNEDRDFKSESTGNFTDKSHPGMGARRPAPGSVRGPSLPFEGQSTHSTDFRGTRGAPSTPVVPRLMFTSQPEDRDFVSESHGKHNDKGVQPRVGTRGLNTLAPSVPFDGQSTHATDFPHWQGARPSTSARPAPSALAQQTEDRDFKSETARNFDNKPIPPRQSTRGGAAWNRTGDDRDFVTESKGHLGPKGYQKRETMKPKATTHVQGLPFDGQSTAKTDFREFPGAQPARARHVAHMTTAGPEDRDFVTDARVLFPPQPLPPTSPSAAASASAAVVTSPSSSSSIQSPSRRAGAAIMAGASSPPYHAIPYNPHLDTAHVPHKYNTVVSA